MEDPRNKTIKTSESQKSTLKVTSNLLYQHTGINLPKDLFIILGDLFLKHSLSFR